MRPTTFSGNIDDVHAAASACGEGFAQVELIYVFGSVAEQRANAESDLDIAVLLAPSLTDSERGDLQLRLIGFFSARLRCDRVDIVLLNEAPPLLEFQAIKHGQLLFARTPLAAEQYQVEALNRYYDFQPTLEFHRQRLYHDAPAR